VSAWGCRSCPTPGCRVLLGPEGLVWGVASGSKGSEPPEGWQDPNRGWAGNRTFVKRHLDELLWMHSPDVALFSHDWAPTKAMLVLNCPEVPPEAYAGIAPIFERSHPGFILATDTSQKAAEAMAETTEEVAEKATHAALSASGGGAQEASDKASATGAPTSGVATSAADVFAAVDAPVDSRPLPRVLLEETGLQSYTLETHFTGGAASARTHFEALLFLLCRHANFSSPAEELRRECAVAAAAAMPPAVARVEAAVW